MESINTFESCFENGFYAINRWTELNWKPAHMPNNNSNVSLMVGRFFSKKVNQENH